MPLDDMRWPMHRVALHHIAASGTPDAARRAQYPLAALLGAVADAGSISASGAVLGSYRHVWGELKRWESALGQPPIYLEKGQAARLTDFGTVAVGRAPGGAVAADRGLGYAELEHAFAAAF